MNAPSFDHIQEPNLRAANEHLRRQAERVPVLMQQLGVIQVELRDRNRQITELLRVNGELRKEIERWKAEVAR